MNKLDEIVIQYLSRETSYALMITGEWGVGKTYYYKNVLVNKIKAKPLIHDQSKNYKPILISLFGLGSIESIQAEILLALLPFLKDKTVKISVEFLKLFVKGFMYLKGLDSATKIIDEAEASFGKAKDIINYKNLVICFDDLERKSPKLDIHELIGFINQLVDNEGIKVLIIANEKKTEKDFPVLKEKVIGVSVEFIASTDITFKSIISQRFKGYKTYSDFLDKHSQILINTFTRSSTNFRILEFALTVFHDVFSEIEKNLFKENSLIEIKNKILEDLLRFTIAISIEFRLGKISKANCNGLNETSNLVVISKPKLQKLLDPDQADEIILLEEVENNNPEKSFKEIFLETYYITTNTQRYVYNFYHSLYEYITSGGFINYSDLLNEIIKFYHIDKEEVLPQYKIYNKLNYNDCFTLNDKEYKHLTKELLLYADKGLYDIKDYLTIFRFAIRFGNPLKFDVKRLEQRLILGMQKGKKNFKYEWKINHQLTVDNREQHNESLVNIKNASILLNQQIYEEEIAANINGLRRLFFDDPEVFYKQLLEEESNSSLPVFKYFNVNSFYSALNKHSNLTRLKFVRLLKDRYGDFASPMLKDEINFFQKLMQKIERRPKNIIDGVIFNTIHESLNNAITNLNKISLLQ